ncbi:MAG: hypothetical protein ACK5XN_23535 [Bacteroidota bacterium]
MDAISREKRALFLLDRMLRISGVVLEGRLLDQQQALALWQAHAWQPSAVGQPWPVDPAGMQERRFEGLHAAAPQW